MVVRDRAATSSAPYEESPDPPSPSWKQGALALVTVAVALGLISALFHALNLDLRIESLFYRPDGGWLWRHAQPWEALYRWGTIPGLLLTIGSLGALSVSLVTRRWTRYQNGLLVIALTAILGAGLLVNAVLKPYWGRPRPRQVQAFAGEWAYRAIHQRGTPGQGESFPCGHCTMGYLFVSLFFLRRQAPRTALVGGSFGILYGTLIGAARMVQGAHFPTDVIWALGLIWMTATGLHYFLLPTLSRWMTPLKQMHSGQRWALSAILLFVVVIVTALFLTRRPYFKTFSFDLPPMADLQTMDLTSDLPLERQAVEYGARKQGRLLVHASGFGWVAARCRVTLKAERRPDGLDIQIAGQPRGYFSELSYEVEWLLPGDLEGRVHFSTTP